MDIFYTTKSERRTAIVEAESQGLTMLHDDFNRGPKGEHRLTFEARVDAPDPTVIRRKELLAKLANDTATLSNVKELMRLERGL